MSLLLFQAFAVVNTKNFHRIAGDLITDNVRINEGRFAQVVSYEGASVRKNAQTIASGHQTFKQRSGCVGIKLLDV